MRTDMLTVGLAWASLIISLIALRKARRAMANEQDLEQVVSRLASDVADIAAEVAALKEQVKNQPVTQEQLDSLFVKVSAAADALEAAK